MSYTYDPVLGANKDKVRYLVQDTDDKDWLITDEEINFALSQKGSNLYRAAALVCRTIAAQLGRQLTLVDPAMKLDANEQYEHYIELAKEYEKDGMRSGGVGLFAGGISKSDRDARRDDSDRISPAFSVDTNSTFGVNDQTLSDFD